MLQVIPNRFYTYLKKVDNGPNDQFYVLHYSLHLESNYHSLKWEGPSPDVKTISFGIYEWDGVDDPNPNQNLKDIVLRVQSQPGVSKIAATGIIIINNITFKARWDEMCVRLSILDEQGGPIGGNGSTLHYGDAD